MSSDKHIPIMVEEITKSILEMPNPPEVIVDGTFGRGGHTRAFLNQFQSVRVCAVDRDETAIEHGKKNFDSEVKTGHLNFYFCDFKEFVDLPEMKSKQSWADVVLLDLGVSSPQIDNAERGFSFIHDGPLDMRMDRRQSLTAAQVINEAPPEELIEIFKEYGEVNSPGRVVKAIAMDRQINPFQTTKQLGDMIARVEGWKKKGLHPATLYFMALRIYVNRELEGLEEALTAFQSFLKPGGRLYVLSFHSLEDRIVKHAFLNSTLGGPVNRKVIVASEKEQSVNPRSRSAKLRIFERGLSAVKEKKNKYADKRGIH